MRAEARLLWRFARLVAALASEGAWRLAGRTAVLALAPADRTVVAGRRADAGATGGDGRGEPVSGIAKAQAVLLDRLSTSSTVMLSEHLAVEAFADADGRDALNRPVLLVGAHALRALPGGEEAVQATLDALAAGSVPPGVHALDAAPQAAQGFVQIVEDHGVDEVLLWGERQTGKTIIAAMTLPALAELHARAGYDLPLKALWLHGSLVDASLKTGASLEEPLWGGLWTLRDSRTEAVFTLAGVEMVHAHFIPTSDPTAKERLRAAAHVMLAEELPARPLRRSSAP